MNKMTELCLYFTHTFIYKTSELEYIPEGMLANAALKKCIAKHLI